MLSCIFEVFLASYALSLIMWFTHGLFATKYCTRCYLVYIIVLKRWITKLLVIFMKLCARLRHWGFQAFLAHSRIKCFKPCFVLHNTWYITLLSIYYCVEMFWFENNSHILETWFVLHETLHTTVFGMYYMFKWLESKTYSHILDITC